MWPIEIPVTDNRFKDHENFLKSHLPALEYLIVKKMYDDCLPFYKNSAKTYYGKSDRPWTALIKKILKEIGEHNNFLVGPNPEIYLMQWLFDFIWLEHDPRVSEKYQWMNAPKLVLACESEWRSEDKWHILQDFLKLSFSNARIKLFIYSIYYFKRFGKSVADICRESCCCQKTKYLLIGFATIEQYNEGNGKFKIDYFEK